MAAVVRTEEANTAFHGVFTADTPEKLEQVYDEWAKTYDDTVNNTLGGDGVNHPTGELFEVVKKHVPTAKAILDVGAGTGVAGPLLAAQYSPSQMIALDLSKGMLDVARALPNQGGYTDFVQACCPDLGTATGPYDLIFCAGTFTPNHAPPETLRTMLQVTQPGAFICFSVRNYYFDDVSSGFSTLQQAIVDEGKWELVAKEERIYLPKENVYAYNFVYKVLQL